MGGILLMVIVLGSIYGGIASPTEAAAVSAVYAYAIAVFGYRDMGPLREVPWRREGESAASVLVRNTVQMLVALPKSVLDPEVRKVVLEASKVSVMLLFVIANAMLFAHVLTTERIPHHIAEAITGVGPAGVVVPARRQHHPAARRQLHGAVGDHPDHGADLPADRPEAGDRPDPPRHHHGREHGNRHDHAAGGAQPVRHRRA